MILTISKKCDILHYYGEWLIERFRQGFVDVEIKRDVFKRYALKTKDIEGILFWTHNPNNFLPYLDEFFRFGFNSYMFVVNFNLYDDLIEPKNTNTPVISAIKELAGAVGKDRIIIRYAPLIFNDLYTEEQHKMYIRQIAKSLDGYAGYLLIPAYANTALKYNRRVRAYDAGPDVIQRIHQYAEQVCADNGMVFQPCNESDREKSCFCANLFMKSANAAGFALGNTSNCPCKDGVDIGHYSACTRGCTYCKDKSPRRSHLHNKTDSALNYIPCGAKILKDVKQEPFFRHQVSLQDLSDAH